MMTVNPDYPLWFKTLLLVGSIAVMGLLFMLEARASENPDFDHRELDNVSSGTLLVQNEAGSFSHSPVLSTSIGMTISGMVARIRVEQSFSNPGREWLEGIYLFPLPESAAVNSMTIQIGDRIIKGRITEKNRAEKEYRQAREAGKVASLVRQERPNLFTSNIANIAPGETIRITLNYVQTVAFRDDEFSLRFPMTITPRYANASVIDVQAISSPQFFPAERAIPTAALRATLHLPGAISTLRSSSHELVLQENTDDSSINIRFKGTQLMDRDLVMSWRPVRESQPALSSWIESIDNQDYLLAMLVPPKIVEDASSPARELILVMDTSGSMAGESIIAARNALHAALDGLSSNDRFNLIEFNSRARQLFPGSIQATARNLHKAHGLVNSLSADGGTEMESALRLALANPVDGFLRQIVFITDGSVGNEDHLFSVIENQLRRSRLFTVGIGSAPNSYFMKKAAEAGRGTYTYIGHSREALGKIGALFLALENPALTDISIEWHGEDADYAPAPIADLYLGEPLLVSARLGEATTGFHVKGRFGDLPWEQSVQLRATPRVASGLSTIWARQKIESLLDSQRRADDPEQFRTTITDIALEHELVSKYTSLLAVDSMPVRPTETPLHHADLATALPVGTALDSITLPQGAAGSDSLMLLSLLSTLLALVCYCLQRKQARGRTGRRHVRTGGV